MKKVKEGYKMTELGEIPVDWEVNRLEEICEFLDGKRKPIKAEDRLLMQGGIPYYGASGIIDWVNDYLFDDELILLGEDGENIKSRNVPLAFKVNGKCWVNNHAHVLKIKNNESDDIDYITYSLENKDYSSYVIGSAQPKLNQAECRKFLLLRPKLKEQQKISLILTSVDEQIEITDNLIEKTKELKKGLMQKLLTKGIGHSRFKDTEIGKIPEEWEIRRLGDIGEIVTGSTPKTAEKDNYGSEYLWVSPTDMGEKKYIIKTNKMLSKMGFEKTRKLPKGSILVTCIGSTIGKIGISGYELSTNQQINSIICKSNFDNEFIYYIIDFNFSNYMSYISTQAVPIINKTTFSEFQIQVPPVEEQRKISLILSSVDKQIDQYESKKEKLQELKKGLMQKLLTGRIRVKV